MRRLICLLICTGFFAAPGWSQLKIDNAVFFIGSGAVVTVQGDVTSNVDIQGTGKLLLKGSSLQNVDMGGFTIPNLELDNLAHATLLNTNARIGTSFLLTNGKFQTGNLNLSLSPTANITGQASTRFIWTNGTGQLMKELANGGGDISGYELPVGENANYRPAYLTTLGVTFSSANFGVRVIGTADPNKPPSTAAHLNTAWPVTKTGMTGGTTTLAGQYIDPTDVAGPGAESSIFGYYYNNTTTDWSSVGETHNSATNQVSAPVSSNAGTVSGINKFLAVGARAFLQGAYQAPITTVGLMNDALRLLPFGPASSTANFPQDDPYRQTAYSTSFPHFGNLITETIPNSGVIGAQTIPGNNIVDWVFLELRDLVASPNNNVIQTRSALIQRDGDIVDVDGVSPVTFNGLIDGNYIITVRHRNHFGLSLEIAAAKNFTETKSLAFSAPKVADLMAATDADLFGNNIAFTTLGMPASVKALWGGNANTGTLAENARIKYAGLGSELNTILLQVTSFPTNPTGIYSFTGAIGYFSGDCNMNRNVRYVTSSDGNIVFANILSLSPVYSFTGLTQQIQN